MRFRRLVRPMRPADAPAMARIEQAVFRRDAWPRSAFAYLHAVFATARSPRGRLWVAEGDTGTVVGYVALELSALGGEADVVNLVVDPAHRRQGIGRALMAAVLRYARIRRVELLWLRVRARNRGARLFYRRCGFEPLGRFRRYYDDPSEDAVLMGRRLEQVKGGQRPPSKNPPGRRWRRSRRQEWTIKRARTRIA